MNDRILSRLNPEHLGGVSFEELAHIIRHSPTGVPETSDKDGEYSVTDGEFWENLYAYESIEHKTGGYVIWKYTDGGVATAMEQEDSYHPNRLYLVMDIDDEEAIL